MKSPPTDPFALQARSIQALCEDLFDIGAGRSTTFARTNALRAVISAPEHQEDQHVDNRR